MVEIQPRRTYRHYKGGVYFVNGFGESEKTGNSLVIYTDIYTGKTWIRPCSEWDNDVTNNNNETVKRFSLIEKKK